VSSPRYAIYFAPEAVHPLASIGVRWLAGDAAPATGHVEAPRRYGFHATLKPPMALRPGAEAGAFLDAVDALAAEHRRFEMPPLSVQWLGDFLALRPRSKAVRHEALHALADDCVRRLDPWRAPPGPDELQRRAAGLDSEQHALLLRWGYPHVLQRWRFHMTLSDPLPPDDRVLRERLMRAAEDHFAAALAAPLRCESLAVFIEPAPGEPLRLIHHSPLA
jgi:hypothetical protein